MSARALALLLLASVGGALRLPARVAPVRAAARHATTAAAVATPLVGVANAAWAEGADAAAELPPPYLPVAFAVLLLAAIGGLQLSLGDVVRARSCH